MGCGVNFFSFSLSSIQASMDWIMTTHKGEGYLLCCVHQFEWSSHLETPSQTHLEIIFNLGTQWPVKLTHKTNHYMSIHG